MAWWPLLKAREPAAQQTWKDRLSAGLNEAPFPEQIAACNPFALKESRPAMQLLNFVYAPVNP